MRILGKYNGITDVSGISVGNFSDPDLLTGVTVILVDEGAVGGVDVRGGGPGTRETDLLSPINHVERVNGVALCGNSAFGLNAAGGVMSFLEEKGIGYRTERGHVVPIVPAAVLFDLGRGKKKGHISEEFGYKACERASKGRVEQGNVGAGTGAVSGGLKGGIGTASELLENGVTVGALVALNSFGSTVDKETGGFYARHLEMDGEFGNLRSDIPIRLVTYSGLIGRAGQHTTIGVVATDARLTKAQATKVAQMAHDGLARAVYPTHTTFDGDTIFALATGKVEIARDEPESPAVGARTLSLLGASAADAFARAIVHAMLSAETAGSYTCYRDRYPQNFS